MKRALAGAAAAGVVVLGGSGFARSAPPLAPTGPSRSLGMVPLPPDLPDLLRRHLDVDGDGLVPRMDTISLWGRGQLRSGILPWLPVRMRTAHRVGAAFAADIELTWHGRSLLTATEAAVDGRGLSRQGSKVNLGPEVDQGANLFLWSEAALIPSVFASEHAPGARQVGAEAVELALPSAAGSDTAVLHFRSGRPVRFSARRHKGVGRPETAWHVDYVDWEPTHGIMLPRHLEVTWAGDGGPWFRLDTDGFAANIDVEARLERIAAVLARSGPASSSRGHG